MMQIVTTLIAAAAAVLVCSSDGTNAFTPTPAVSQCNHSQPQTSMLMSSSSDSDEPAAPPAPNLVSQADFVAAIDVLKKDMGMEIIPEDQRPMYAIGKLVAPLPLEHVGGVRFADCETLTLISQMKRSAVDATGMSSLDTIVAIRAGNREGGEGGGAGYYEGDTKGRSIAYTARAYTDAINYAMEHGLKEIELEVNRLVPMMPTDE